MSNLSQQQQLPDLVSFNCGGEIITIQRSKVLSRYPSSFFANFLQLAADPVLSKSLDKDKNGNILLDRDPKYFLCIVNFCRGYRSVGPANDEDFEALLVEADYWCLPQLRKTIEEKIGLITANTPSCHQRLHFLHAPPPEQVEKFNKDENEELINEYFGPEDTETDGNNSNHDSNNSNNSNDIDNEIDRILRLKNDTYGPQVTSHSELINSPWVDPELKKKIINLDAQAEARAKYIIENQFFSQLNFPNDLRFMRGPGVSTDGIRFRNTCLVTLFANTVPDNYYTLEEEIENKKIEKAKRDRFFYLSPDKEFDEFSENNSSSFDSATDDDVAALDVVDGRKTPPLLDWKMKINRLKKIQERKNTIVVDKPRHFPSDNFIERKYFSSTSSSSSSSSSSSPSTSHSYFMPNAGAPMVAGLHYLHLEILKVEYLAIGIVSDQSGFGVVQQDSEFHRTPGCVAYYHSGVFYANTPNSFKEDNLAKLTPGTVVQVRLDMDNRIVEFFVNGNCERMQSIAFCPRVRFACVAKLNTAVSIISPDRAAYLIGQVRAEKLLHQHEKNLKEVLAARAKQQHLQQIAELKKAARKLFRDFLEGCERIALDAKQEANDIRAEMSRMARELLLDVNDSSAPPGESFQQQLQEDEQPRDEQGLWDYVHENSGEDFEIYDEDDDDDDDDDTLGENNNSANSTFRNRSSNNNRNGGNSQQMMMMMDNNNNNNNNDRNTRNVNSNSSQTMVVDDALTSESGSQTTSDDNLPLQRSLTNVGLSNTVADRVNPTTMRLPGALRLRQELEPSQQQQQQRPQNRQQNNNNNSNNNVVAERQLPAQREEPTEEERTQLREILDRSLRDAEETLRGQEELVQQWRSLMPGDDTFFRRRRRSENDSSVNDADDDAEEGDDHFRAARRRVIDAAQRVLQALNIRISVMRGAISNLRSIDANGDYERGAQRGQDLHLALQSLIRGNQVAILIRAYNFELQQFNRTYGDQNNTTSNNNRNNNNNNNDQNHDAAEQQ